MGLKSQFPVRCTSNRHLIEIINQGFWPNQPSPHFQVNSHYEQRKQGQSHLFFQIGFWIGYDISCRNGIEIPFAFVIDFLRIWHQGISHISRSTSTRQDNLDIVMLISNSFRRGRNFFSFCLMRASKLFPYIRLLVDFTIVISAPVQVILLLCNLQSSL